MKSFNKLLAAIEAGSATMADIDAHIADMEAESAKGIADCKAAVERAVLAEAERARLRAIESALYGRSRIAYALATRK